MSDVRIVNRIFASAIVFVYYPAQWLKMRGKRINNFSRAVV
jgi:hypothetical protein